MPISETGLKKSRARTAAKLVKTSVLARALFADIFAPRTCISCFGLSADCYLCQRCRQANDLTLAATCIVCDRRRPHNAAGLVRCCEQTPATLWSLGPYEQPALAQLIATGKFAGAYDCFDWLGRWLGRELKALSTIFAGAGLVPIPMTKLDERRRGFNQSLIIASALGQISGLPLVPCLTKTRQTKPQRTLDRDKRIENIHGAFSSSGAVPRLAILIDDVKTTGATLREAGRVLRQAGAKTVLAVTIAR